MDRSVCGNISRFSKFTLPALLIYDIEDECHPIEQGELLYKELLNTEFYTYKNSEQPYWVPDHIWDTMIKFFSRHNRQTEKKIHIKCEKDKRSKSYSKLRSNSNSKNEKKYILVERFNKLLKSDNPEPRLLEVREH